MLRTTVGLSFLVLFGALSACSSKATDSNTTGGAAGNGALLGGSSSGGSGGSGGTRTDAAGTTSANGGTTPNTGGTTSGLCPGDPVTCIDDTMATFCDPDTGVEETFSCVDDAATIGFVSTGCKMGTGLAADQCALESVIDDKCFAGAQGYAFCGGFTTREQLVNIYINCFQDNNGGHTVVQCFADYVSETMMADSDCLAAEQACLGLGAGGAGAGPEAGGAGGAP